ncbi:MAG: hypothetical protein M3083_20850 [Actinomycetota bacterium]|nr:hypothetical protein [Actinomycetota bacterium]
MTTTSARRCVALRATKRAKRPWVVGALAVCLAAGMVSTASASIIGPLPAPLPPTGAPAPAADPAQGNSGVLDTTGTLQLNPPFTSLPTLSPFKADDTITDQLTIEICRFNDGGCDPVDELSTTSASAPEQLRRVGPLYTANWLAGNTVAGQIYRVTFRIACLNIGSAQLRAVAPVDVLSVPAAGTFVAGLPVPIVFSVDKHPVIRARSSHDRGIGGIDTTAGLQRDFSLNDTDSLRVLYHDVRGEDLSPACLSLASAPPPPAPTTTTTSTTSAPSASAAKAAAPAGAAAPAKAAAPAAAGHTTTGFAPSAFPLNEIADSVGSPTTFNDPAARVASILHSATASSNLSILNALLNSNVFGSKLNAADVLAIIRNALGVTDRIEGLRLLGAAQQNGATKFTPVDILRARSAVEGTPTLLQALLDLADLGYKAPVAMSAASQANLIPLGDAKSTVINLAKAAMQVAGFPSPDILDGLYTLYGSDQATLVAYPQPVGLRQGLVDGGQQLVGENCGQYRQAGVSPGSVVDLMRGRVDVLPPATVVYALVGANGQKLAGGADPCHFDKTAALTSMHNAYFSAVANPATEAIDLASSLALSKLPASPATDLLLAVAKTMRDAARTPPDSRLACVTSVGAVAGGGMNLPDVTKNLNGTPDLAQVIANPFGTGAGGNLDQLGQCLVGNGIIPPLPLRMVEVYFCCGQLNSRTTFTDEEIFTSRAGWLPRIPDNLPAGPLGALNLAKVPNLPGLPGALKNAATLPVLAMGPGQFCYSNCNGTTTFDYGDHRGTFDNLGICPDPPGCDPAEANYYSQNTKDSGGLPYFTQLGPAGKARARMIVPAIPGSINLESDFFTSPNLNCSPFRKTNEALARVAIAAPYVGVYDKLPGAKNDLISSGQAQVNLPELTEGKNSMDIHFDYSLVGNPDGCGGVTNNTDSAHMVGNINVKFLSAISTVKELQDLLGQATSVSVPTNATANGQDFSFSNLNMSSAVDPASLTGNFFSLLAATGTTGLAGPALASMMTGGFPG